MMRYLRKSSRFFKFLKFQKRKNLTVTQEKKSNFQISLKINVDRNHILSLSVIVLFSYFHFQKSRENP